MAQTTSVLWSVDQGLGENAKEQARQNSGAASVKSVDDVKSDLSNLTDDVNAHTTEIGQIKEDVKGIESALTNKKDKQTANTFTGSATKTVKNISQNANGELTVEFEDIDLPQEVAVNLNQDFTPEEMTTARNNIGAASSEQVTKLNGNLSVISQKVSGLEQQIQQDKFDIYQHLLK